MKRKLIFIMLLDIILLCVTGYFGVQLLQHDINSYQMKTYTLGINKRIGTIGADIKYDVQPVDVILVSPSGKQYSNSVIDQENKIMQITTVSNEKGKWKIIYNKKANKSIKYSMIVRPSQTVMMDNITAHLDKKQKKLKITCLPVYSEPTDTETQIQMTISISYDETHKILFNGNISANTPWENIFTLEDSIDPDNQQIKLIMATQDPDDYNNQSFKTSTRLKIITDVDTSKDIK